MDAFQTMLDALQRDYDRAVEEYERAALVRSGPASTDEDNHAEELARMRLYAARRYLNAVQDRD